MPERHEPIPPLPATVGPHDIEAEQRLLGALMLYNDLVEETAATLAFTDFYEPIHQRVYLRVLSLVRQGKGADPVVLKHYFAKDEAMAQVGGIDYLARMAGVALSGSTELVIYIAHVRQLSERRQVLASLRKATEAIELAENEPDAELAKMEVEIAHIDEQRPAVSMSYAKASEIALDRMNLAFSGEKLPGTPLLLPVLDKVHGNMLPGDMIVLGGRPSMGKSAVMIDLSYNLASEGYPVVYWCGEMTPEDNAERILSAFVRKKGLSIPYHDARKGKMNEEQFRALIEAGRDTEKLPLDFVDPSVRQLDRLCYEIRRRVRRWQRNSDKTPLVVMDYLQLIRVGSASRFEAVTEASLTIKELAVSLRVPVFVGSQLSRGLESRDNKRPMLSDLRESGQIEQDAQSVLFLYRHAYYVQRLIDVEKDDAKRSSLIAWMQDISNEMEIIIAKQRSGPTSTSTIGFDGGTNTLWNPSEGAPKTLEQMQQGDLGDAFI